MSLILNVIWFVFGGWAVGLAWWFAGILLALTIVGMPWASAAWRIGSFSFWPVGREIVDQSLLEGYEEPVTDTWRLFLNIIWFLLAGWYLVIAHVLAAAVFALTLIGIPFAFQHLKLAALSLAPVGKAIVPVELASEARHLDARTRLAKLRS